MGETRNRSSMDKDNLRVRIKGKTNSLTNSGLNSNSDAAEFRNPEHAIKPIYSLEPTVAGFPNNFPKHRFGIATIRLPNKNGVGPIKFERQCETVLET
jgi:hypothetical protein